MKISNLLLPLLLITAIICKAQVFGGNPPSIKWDQVNTPETKVIFPYGLDSTGQRVADIIHRMNGAVKPTIGFKQKQVSIVLQNQNTVSNAYVGLAPFRSEFYLTPEQNSFELGSLNWADQLAIHEYRHVQQYNNFNVGLSHGLRFLFGEAGQALGNELAIPNWFFEGDAVYNETLVSRQGRGRIPYFFNGYRALWAAGRNYSYQKLRNGSYQDFVPDHYPLGYMLVSYGREQYGDAFWKNVTHDAAAYHSLFYPFQNSFKKQAKVSFTDFRKEALAVTEKTFGDKKQPAKPHQHFIADQEYPAYTEDGALIYMRSTYDHRPFFIVSKNGEERTIRVRDLSLDNYFAYHNGQIIYAAYQPDNRWGYRTYSDLKIIDVKSGEERRLTRHTKYFAPDFSADASKIITVETAPTGKTTLCVLDATNGKVVNRVANPANLFYTYPKFYGGDKVVSAVRKSGGAMQLSLIDIASGQVEQLADAPLSGFLALKGDTVYFSAAEGTSDRLFAFTLKDRKLYKLRSDSLARAISNYQPAITNDKIAFTSFTAFGYKLHQLDKKDISWSAVNVAGNLGDLGIKSLEKDSAAGVLAKVNNVPLPVTKYNKAYHLFNFHSLLPEFNDPNYSLSLVGENVLNTFQSSLLFNYNRDEGYKEFGFSAAYGGLYPVLRASVDYTIDRKGYYQGNDVFWNETELRGGAYIPLLFTNGTQITNLTFGSDAVYNSTNFQQAFQSQFKDHSYVYLNNYVIFSNRIAQARKNIYPSLAQNLTVSYKNAVSGITADQFLASGTLYLPGLFANHSLVINGAFQQRNRNSQISFSNNFPFSRGYTAENLYQLEKVGANYHFPIAYPDAGLANTVYLLRLRGNLYYDYTHANDFYYPSGNPFKADFKTVGGELYFDTSWFNQVPITFGIRYAHLLDPNLFGGTGRDRIELIVPLTLF